MHRGLKSGQKVCILGGLGGVGSLAIQMTKAMGAASSADMIEGSGMDSVVNCKEQHVAEELEGKELDLVIDTVGGIDCWTAANGGLEKGGKC
jgi:NADPH:quinone reductase-like Zn-dependent oxidoreductase